MRTQTIVALSTLLFAGLGINVTNAQTAPALVCGLDVYPSPTGFPSAEPSSNAQLNLAGDPCTEGETILGPTRLDRTEGKPQLDVLGFTLEADADVCIVATAGDKGKAFLYVDGGNIAEPEDFDDGGEVQTHSLAAGGHGLGVTPVGTPGGFVEVEIRQLANGGGGDPGLPEPGEVQIDPDTGALDMVNADGSVRLQNVATDHPLLTPNGDGHHDTTVFQSLTTPLVELPGKDDGTVAYFLNWEFQIVDLATCNTIDTGLLGSTQINSPTLVTTTWNGTDTMDTTVPPGNYAYIFGVIVVDEFGIEAGSIEAPAFAFVVATLNVDYDEKAERLPQCNVAADPSNCECPGVGGAPGTPDADCAFAFVNDLLPGGSFPFGSTPNYYTPSDLDLSFIKTTQDPVTNRYTVTVDLREQEQNAMGLVPKGFGLWNNEADLRQWVSDMTGVPVSTGDGLFNFDYVQIGNSTGVSIFGLTFHTFNHFLLDAMTNDFGQITVGGVTTDLAGGFNDDLGAPGPFLVVDGREGDECNNNGNTDGANNLWGKFCAYNTAVAVGDSTDLGIHLLRTTVFDLNLNGDLTKQDELCVIDGLYHCGVRTRAVRADTIEIESSYYADGVDPIFTRTETVQQDDATGLSGSVDRAAGEDGVCSKAVATRNELAVRMDAADGTVPDSCIINGIF